MNLYLEKNNLIYLSSDLTNHPDYADLFRMLTVHKCKYRRLLHAKDICLRDSIPVQAAPQLNFNVTHSDISPDGGNIVFSPSRQLVLRGLQYKERCFEDLQGSHD